MSTNTPPPVHRVDPDSPHTRRYAIEPSGPRGDNPATSPTGPTAVRSNTPENAAGHIKPSPEDANATPGTTPDK